MSSVAQQIKISEEDVEFYKNEITKTLVEHVREVLRDDKKYRLASITERASGSEGEEEEIQVDFKELGNELGVEVPDPPTLHAELFPVSHLEGKALAFLETLPKQKILEIHDKMNALSGSALKDALRKVTKKK